MVTLNKGKKMIMESSEFARIFLNVCVFFIILGFISIISTEDKK